MLLVDYENTPIWCRYCLATTQCVKDCQELIWKCKLGQFQKASPRRRINLDQQEPTFKRTLGQYTNLGPKLDQSQLILEHNCNKDQTLEKGKQPTEHDDEYALAKTKKKKPKGTKTPQSPVAALESSGQPQRQQQ